MSPNFGGYLQVVLIRIRGLRERRNCNWSRNRGQGGAPAAKRLKGKEKSRGQHQKWCNFWRKFGDKFGDTILGISGEQLLQPRRESILMKGHGTDPEKHDHRHKQDHQKTSHAADPPVAVPAMGAVESVAGHLTIAGRANSKMRHSNPFLIILYQAPRSPHAAFFRAKLKMSCQRPACVINSSAK